MKVHKLKEDWDFSIDPTDAEVSFRREVDMYRKVFSSQPIYLVCPQYTYEIEVSSEKVKELLENGELKIKGVNEQFEFIIEPTKKEILPKIEEDSDGLKEALYVLDGLETYRVEVSLDFIEDCLEKGYIDRFPNSSSEMLFEKAKKAFQAYCQTNGFSYTSWVNE
jgi:hypothetical protein